MTRLKKNNADYFPHDNNMWSDRKIVALRNKFGLEGYAIWNLLLECLCESEDFVIDTNDDELELLADFWGLERDKLRDVLDFMARIGLIRREADKVFCQQLRKRLQPLLDERARKRTWSKKATQSRWNKDSNSEELDVYRLELDGKQTSSSGNETGTSMRKERRGEERKGKILSAQNEFAPGSCSKMNTDDFDKFWELYPRKRAKQKAREKFLKLERALLPAILAAVDQQKMTLEWQKHSGQYIPYPTTWLNGRRWEDDLTTLTHNQHNHERSKGCPQIPSGHTSSDGDADIVITEDDVQM